MDKEYSPPGYLDESERILPVGSTTAYGYVEELNNSNTSPQAFNHLFLERLEGLISTTTGPLKKVQQR